MFCSIPNTANIDIAQSIQNLTNYPYQKKPSFWLCLQQDPKSSSFSIRSEAKPHWLLRIIYKYLWCPPAYRKSAILFHLSRFLNQTPTEGFSLACMAKLKKRLIQLQSKENDDRLNSLLHINIKAITKLHASKIKHYFRASYLSRKVRFCAQADAPATTTSLARVAKDIFALEESSTLGNHSKTSVPKTRKIFTSKEPLIILQEKMQYFISNPQAYTQIVPVSGTYPRIALDELPALVKTHQPAFTLYLECLEHLSQQTHWTLPLGNNSLYKKLNQATQKLISEFSKPPLNKEDPYYLFFNILLAALLEETKQLLTSKLSKKNMRCVACFSLS